MAKSISDVSILQKRIKISDIAKAAGVSPSTVSYVLSGQRSISQKTKDIVMEQVEKLGYKPNAMARNFVTNRSNTIGLYIDKNVQQNDLFLLSTIVGVTRALNAKRYKLLLLDEMDNATDDFAIPVDRTFAIDGAIVSNTRSLGLYLSELEKEHIPFVLMGKPPKNSDLYYVDNDNMASVYHMMEYFFNKGLSRIALVVNSSPTLTFGLDYITGYTMAYNDYQKEYDSKLIFKVDNEKTDVNDFKEKIAKLKVDGILVDSLISSLRDFCILQDGTDSPIPVAFFAFDIFKEYLPGPLPKHISYINSNAVELGEQCANMLLDIIDENPPKSKKMLLEQELFYSLEK